MAIWKWNTFTGISDDSFLAKTGEFYSCNNVDLINKARYVDAQLSSPASIVEIGVSITSPIIITKDSASYPVFGTANRTYLGFG